MALVGAQSHQLLMTLVAPGELRYNEAKEKLQAHFRRNPQGSPNGFDFTRDNNSKLNLWSSMSRSYEGSRLRANSLHSWTKLLDKFVSGMTSQRKVLSQADRTLTKTLEITQGMDKDSKEIQATPIESP